MSFQVQARIVALAVHMADLGHLRSDGSAPILAIDHDPTAIPPVKFYFTATATPAQKAAALNEARTFDYRIRKGKNKGVIRSEVVAYVDLPGNGPPWAQRLLGLTSALAEELLSKDPQLARRYGIALDGDEPE